MKRSKSNQVILILRYKCILKLIGGFKVHRIEEMIQDVRDLNVTHVGIVNTEEIEFSKEFRKMCEQNKCGMAGTNWMCPPGVGSFESLRDRAMAYKKGIVLQTVHPLESSFDLKGMEEGAAKHNEVFRKVIYLLATKYQLSNILPLNVGPCTYCKKCTYTDGKPCRFPDKAVASVEAYGIDVMKLLRNCDIPYNSGKNTVSYNSLIVFNLSEEKINH